MNLVFRAQNSQPIRGPIKSDFSIIKTVSGLRIPIRCYLASGVYVGSCVHTDYCQFLTRFSNFTAENCPSFLVNNSMDCTCPFNLPARLIDINTAFDLPVFSNSLLNFFLSSLLSGQFDVNIKLTQENTSILCLNFKFSIRGK